MRAILFLLAFATHAVSAERISGASLVDEAVDVDDVLYEVLALPMPEEEVAQFLAHHARILVWAEANAKQWAAADESDAPLETIRAFAIWKSSSLNASEFVAIVAKLMFARDFADDPMDVAQLQRQLVQLKAKQANPKTSERERLELYGPIHQLDSLIKIIEGGAAEKVALYRVQREVIDAALGRLEKIGSE